MRSKYVVKHSLCAKLETAVSDPKFNAMMSQIKDKAEQGLEFRQRVEDAIKGFPSYMKALNAQEGWVAERTKEIKAIEDALTRKYKSVLRPVLVHFQDGVGLFDVLEMTCTPAPGETDYGLDALGLTKESEEAVREVVDNFVRKHRVEIDRTVRHMEKEIEETKKLMKTMPWPGGTYQYVYRYRIGGFADLEREIKNFRKSVGHLIN